MLSIHGLGDGFSLQVVADDGVMVPGGRGGVLQISSDRDDRLGAKIKTQKNPWTKI